MRGDFVLRAAVWANQAHGALSSGKSVANFTTLLSRFALLYTMGQCWIESCAKSVQNTSLAALFEGRFP